MAVFRSMDVRYNARPSKASRYQSSAIQNHDHRSRWPRSLGRCKSRLSSASAGDLWPRTNLALDSVLVRSKISRRNAGLEGRASGPGLGFRGLFVRIHESDLLRFHARQYRRQLLVQLAREPMGNSAQGPDWRLQLCAAWSL